MPRKKPNNRRRHRASKKGDYRSIFEKDFATHLKKRKVEFEYESEKISYVVEKTYAPDWVLKKLDGTNMYIETKGVLDARSRSVLKNAKKCNPELDFRIIFQRGSNTISKASSTTYLEWARKNGFPCAEVRMPNEWKKEIVGALK